MFCDITPIWTESNESRGELWGVSIQKKVVPCELKTRVM